MPASAAQEQENRTPAGFPRRVAAVDVGSNAIRMVAAEFTGATRYRVLFEERAAVRLGHDVFIKGRLADAAMDGAVEALQRFRERFAAEAIDDYRAVATSAVREAANAERFLRRVAEEAGLALEMITGAEEARLIYVAVGSRVPLTGGLWMLVDLGGGSVEVSLVDETGIQLSESHTMGSVRLLEELSAAGAQAGRFRRLLEEYTATLRFPQVVAGQAVQGLIATGGNIETLARLGSGASPASGVLRLPIETLRTLIDELARLSYRERIDQLGLREDRADVILPAALVYERVARLAGVDTLLVPQVGLRDGVLIDLIDDLASHRGHAEKLERQAFAAGLALGRRFGFDEPHGLQVARLAGELFTQLAGLHGLGEDDRRMLRVAALLHDVGVRVNHKKHHKHTQYLIANSELGGFSPLEIRMLAAVARYHRKGEPAPHHAEYMGFAEPDRLRVARLAALLRIAAALDREHRQRVSAVVARRSGDVVLLELRGTGDLLLERWALERNKALFERVFQTRLEVVGGVG